MALNDVPKPGESLNATQSPIRTNFQTIGTSFAIDHVTYGDPNQGKHNRVTFPGAVADPVLAAGEIALYSKLDGAANQLFIKKGAAAAYDFTNAAAADPGWTRLPSGILLKWGSAVMGGPGPQTYTFPVGATIPAFTQIFNIIVTTSYNDAGGGNGFARLNNFGAPWTSFDVYGSQRTTLNPLAVGFTYLAIGR